MPPVREVKEFRVSSLSSAAEYAQTCHDDRFVELKEQLGIEEEDGEKAGRTSQRRRERSNQRERAMSMIVDDYEWTQNSSHEVCGVIIKYGTVRAMCRLNA